MTDCIKLLVVVSGRGWCNTMGRTWRHIWGSPI